MLHPARTDAEPPASPGPSGADPWPGMADVWLDGARVSLWRTHSDRMNVALLERWLPGPLGAVLKTDVFDEAVGPGLLPALAPRASRLVGIDVEERIVARAAQRMPALEAVCADVRTLPFADGTFDTVLSISTLDHLPDAAAIRVALAELARVVRPGGRVLVTLDNPRNPVVALAHALPRDALNRRWSAVARTAGRVGLTPYVVGATLPAAALAQELAAVGLDPVATETHVHAPRLPAVLVGSLVERLRSPSAARAYLAALARAERLGRTRVAPVAAHFSAVLAVRRA